MIAVLHALRYAIVLRSCHRNLVQSLYLMPFHIQNRLIVNLGYDILCILPKMIIRKIVITEQACTYSTNNITTFFLKLFLTVILLSISSIHTVPKFSDNLS